jgi:hypothetical protein
MSDNLYSPSEPEPSNGRPADPSLEEDQEEEAPRMEMEYTQLTLKEQQEFSFHSMACAWDELLDAKLAYIEAKFKREMNEAKILLSGELTGTVQIQKAQLLLKMEPELRDETDCEKRLEVAKVELAQAKLQDHYWKDTILLSSGGVLPSPDDLEEEDSIPY